jgi:ligand-binding sensor domain-containing protein
VLAPLLLLALSSPAVAADADPCPEGTWTTLHRGAGVDNDYINAIGFTPDGSAWLATNALFPVETHGGGVSRVGPDGAVVVARKASDGLGSDTVATVAVSGSDVLAGTLAGAALARPDGEGGWGWTALPRDIGGKFPLQDVTSIWLDAAGDRWFGTSYGLARQTPTGWRHYGSSEGVGGLETRFVSALVGTEQALWVGSYGQGLWRFEEDADGRGEWTSFRAEGSGLGNDYVHALDVDAAGRIWVGTGIGVAVFDPATDQWRRHTPTNSALAGPDVRAVMADDEGRVWLGTHAGLQIVEGERWRTCTAEDGLAHDVVVSIARAPDGATWVGTFGGGVSVFGEQR